MKRGSRHSAATRARMSEAARAALADPEVRRRMSEAIRAAQADPEVRRRMSEAARERHARRKADAAIAVPAWVPQDLADEFREVARAEDEFAAARHVRRLLAALRAPA